MAWCCGRDTQARRRHAVSTQPPAQRHAVLRGASRAPRCLSEAQGCLLTLRAERRPPHAARPAVRLRPPRCASPSSLSPRCILTFTPLLPHFYPAPSSLLPHRAGDWVEAGTVLAEIVDPSASDLKHARRRVVAETNGLLVARRADRRARATDACVRAYETAGLLVACAAGK